MSITHRLSILYIQFELSINFSNTHCQHFHLTYGQRTRILKRSSLYLKLSRSYANDYMEKDLSGGASEALIGYPSFEAYNLSNAAVTFDRLGSVIHLCSFTLNQRLRNEFKIRIGTLAYSRKIHSAAARYNPPSTLIHFSDMYNWTNRPLLADRCRERELNLHYQRLLCTYVT